MTEEGCLRCIILSEKMGGNSSAITELLPPRRQFKVSSNDC